eukprot:jgi/Mesvir1/9256/Mv03122-RA.1
MFFHLILEKNMRLHPRYFGPKMRTTVVEKLIAEVEGTCSGRYGFIIAVVDVVSLGQAQLSDGSGYATIHVKYAAIVYRPFKGEVMDAVVTDVTKMGFFCESGPLRIFVSGQQIPQDMHFAATEEPCFVANDESVRIQRDSEVRIKIVGLRMDATDIFVVGSIKDDYLGFIGDAVS